MRLLQFYSSYIYIYIIPFTLPSSSRIAYNRNQKYLLIWEIRLTSERKTICVYQVYDWRMWLPFLRANSVLHVRNSLCLSFSISWHIHRVFDEEEWWYFILAECTIIHLGSLSLHIADKLSVLREQRVCMFFNDGFLKVLFCK